MADRSLVREAFGVVVGSIVGAFVVASMERSRPADVAGARVRPLEGLDARGDGAQGYDAPAALAGLGRYARRY